MQILKNRLPPKNVILLVFSICVVPNHVWSIVNTLWDVPAWIIKMSLWEVIGVISYIQTMVLTESIVFFMVLLILAVLLPEHLFLNKFLVRSSIIMVFAVGTSLLIFVTTGIRNIIINLSLFSMIIILIMFAMRYIIKISHQQVNKFLTKIYDPLIILSIFYIIIDVCGIFVVIFRNF